MQHSPAAVHGTPSLLQTCEVPQTPLLRQVFGAQHSELATQPAPLPLHAADGLDEPFELLQPTASESAKASPTSWGRNRVGMAPDLRPWNRSKQVGSSARRGAFTHTKATER